MRGQKSGISQRGRYAVQSLSTVASILLVALLVFFASFYTVYQRTSQELEQDIIAESNQSMVLSAQEVSSAFAREWQLLTESNFAADVRGLLQDCGGSVRYSRLSSLNKLLNSRFASDMPFHSVAIYGMGQEDFFCTQRFVSDDFRADYEAGLFCFDGMSYDEFKATIQNCSAHRVDRRTFVSGELTYVYDSSYSSNAGYYVYRYPNVDASTQIYALLQIDLNGLRNVLSFFRYAGDFFMIEGAGQVLFTTDPGISLHQVKGSLYADDATDTHYLRTVIDNLGFTCYLSIDSHALYESIAHFNQLLHLLSYVFCALTAFTVGLLFLRWHYPVIRVAERIAPNGVKYNPIASIDLHISALTQENNEKARRIELLEPAAKSDLLRRFYLGRPLDEHERDTLCALLPHGEEGAFRCLLLGSLSQAAADRPVLTSLLDVLHAHFQALCAPDVIDGQMAVLVPMEPSDDPAEFLPQLQTLLAGFNAEYPALCAIGASDVYIGYSSVPQAYLEARAGWMDALNWQNPSVVFTGASDPAAVRYKLSYSQLEDLYHALKSGNAEHALALFDEAVAENFPQDSGLHLRRQFCQQFFADIYGVLTRLAVKHDILLVLDSLQNTRQLAFRQRLAELRSALLECAELIGSQTGENNLSSQIQAFCTSHYSDANFSLTAVAQNFHLSESNLSKFFKAHTGITFSSYIENLRISNAEQLLIEGRLSVKSIAAEVGYASTATFYNAFRRTHNCTPTQWLEMRAEYAQAAQNAAR